MEKRKWLWKRKSSERSPGETESSGSISSHSERYSDEQVGILLSLLLQSWRVFPLLILGEVINN